MTELQLPKKSLSRSQERILEAEEKKGERKENRGSMLFGYRKQEPRPSVSEAHEPKDGNKRLSRNMSDASLCSAEAGKQDVPPKESNTPSPTVTGSGFNGFQGRIKSANKPPPLPRKISASVYESFMEHTDVVEPGKGNPSGKSSPTTLDSNKALKSPPPPPPKLKRLSHL